MLMVTRNFGRTGDPCKHCGRVASALWMCPSGFPCTICSDCAGVLVRRSLQESWPQATGWPRFLM